ncbi:hypothetical protein PCE1_000858 [Barthelona sp. PCE]
MAPKYDKKIIKQLEKMGAEKVEDFSRIALNHQEYQLVFTDKFSVYQIPGTDTYYVIGSFGSVDLNQVRQFDSMMEKGANAPAMETPAVPTQAEATQEEGSAEEEIPTEEEIAEYIADVDMDEYEEDLQAIIANKEMSRELAAYYLKKYDFDPIEVVLNLGTE